MADLSMAHAAVPARAGEAPHPCVLLLHGRGADEHDLLGLAGALDARLLCVSVRAPLRPPGLPGYQWHEALRTGTPEPLSMLQSLQRLRRVLAELPAAYSADPRRLYVLGFSQGAAMALALAAAEPASVAGTLALSGYWPQIARAEGLRGRPVFVAHGDADPMLPPAFGRAIRDALAAAGAGLDYREYPMGHQIVPEELDDVHAWMAARLEEEPPA